MIKLLRPKITITNLSVAELGRYENMPIDIKIKSDSWIELSIMNVIVFKESIRTKIINDVWADTNE